MAEHLDGETRRIAPWTPGPSGSSNPSPSCAFRGDWACQIKAAFLRDQRRKGSRPPCRYLGSRTLYQRAALDRWVIKRPLAVETWSRKGKRKRRQTPPPRSSKRNPHDREQEPPRLCALASTTGPRRNRWTPHLIQKIRQHNSRPSTRQPQAPAPWPTPQNSTGISSPPTASAPAAAPAGCGERPGSRSEDRLRLQIGDHQPHHHRALVQQMARRRDRGRLQAVEDHGS